MIPAELRERRSWVLWRFEDRDGKRTKVPYRPAEPGRRAAADDPSTWATFEEATRALEGAEGIGYVFAESDPYTGIDLDGCRDPETGQLEPWAAAIVLALDSYTELSPSETGVHVLVRAELNGGRNRTGRVEMYDQGRFFCMTGEHVPGAPAEILPRQAELDELRQRLFPATPERTPADRLIHLDDEELLRRALAARNGPDFQRLWAGDTSAYGDDHSRADLALCGMLAFWTGPDPGRVDRLFRASGLMRAKWDERRGDASYGARTIGEALASRTDFYSPRTTPISPSAAAPQAETSEEPPTPFEGLSHDQVLALTFEGERQLVDELVEAAVLGVIAGIPETHKSWVATAIAVGVARGEGEILGRRVVAQGAVGYFWQDDSRRNEAERIQTLERVRENPAGLPLTWFLNEGLELPRDLKRLRATVEKLQLCLVVIDSFYNVAQGDLRDRDAGQIVAALKAQVCDPTGCTVLVVDHMPWATDSNRSRLRAYGDVFKGAAARFGIYIDAEHKKLYVEARGNNIRGFKRTPAYWDEETLELRLVDVEQLDEDQLDQLVLGWVCEHPGMATGRVAAGVGKRRENVEKSLERLGRVNTVTAKSSRDLGRAGTGTYWFPANHAASDPSLFDGTSQDGSPPGVAKEDDPSQPSHPRRGDGSPDGRVPVDASDVDARAREVADE